jgi:hypothetical protein
MFLSFLTAATLLFGLPPDALKPACNSENIGRMWPEAANHDHKSVGKLARCGELQICTRGAWRYHWQPLTVTIDQLRDGVKSRRPAGCEEPPDSGASRNASRPGELN